MKAYWLPGISRYARTKEEAQSRSDVSPYEQVTLPDKQQEVIDLLNGMMEGHEKTLAASDIAFEREEAKAKEMGYASLSEALEALRVLRAAEPVEEAPRPQTRQASADGTGFSGDVVEAIFSLEGDRVLDALAASIDRLHETAGYRGWQQFARKTLSWSGGSLATDRGLGMLLMAGLASLPVEERT
jgi:hypothetical protein